MMEQVYALRESVRCVMWFGGLSFLFLCHQEDKPFEQIGVEVIF